MLGRFKKNIYSQGGEDGVLQELLKRLNLGTWEILFGREDMFSALELGS